MKKIDKKLYKFVKLTIKLMLLYIGISVLFPTHRLYILQQEFPQREYEYDRFAVYADTSKIHMEIYKGMPPELYKKMQEMNLIRSYLYWGVFFGFLFLLNEFMINPQGSIFYNIYKNMKTTKVEIEGFDKEMEEDEKV